jgi:hypothetical protein
MLLPIAAPAAPPSALPAADLTLLSPAIALVINNPLHKPTTSSMLWCFMDLTSELEFGCCLCDAYYRLRRWVLPLAGGG